MSGSKTVYYVSSSTSPIFNPSARISNFEAAMLDYTANATIDLSEYIKSFYNVSRLRNIRNVLKYAETSGYSNALGRINATFYGDASFDNVAVANAIRSKFPCSLGETFGVYKTTMGFFNEDFYIKYLASQQGKAHLVYQDSDANYTLSYDGNTIIAKFNNGATVSGTLPTISGSSRFLEISYVKTRAKQIQVKNPNYTPPIVEEPTKPEVTPTAETEPDTEIPDTGEETPTEPEVPPEPEFITITVYEYDYGFYYYQEDTGNSSLDSLIKNNGMKAENTFYPVIPLRTNTA